MIENRKKTVLVIDDDRIIRKLIGHHLSKNNHIVIDAINAEEGFQKLSENKIDLVLCDVTMDDMDGFAFCRKVREDETYRFLPFVFVTAKTSMEDKSEALEAGGDDLITKPFDVNELLLKVQSLLRRTDIYKVYGIKKNLEKSFTKSTEKILIVDDDVSMVKLFKYNLEKEGYECDFAYSANEAFEKISQNIPDLIISDIMMPEISGFKFRKMLLKDPATSAIPFIFLSAKGEEEDILNGYDLGIHDYIVKTSGPKVVLAKVSAILKSLDSERQKVVSELHQAADSLRAKVVPETTPTLEGFEIKQWHVPYQGIPGGDFIDYFKLSKDKCVIVLGDVMGKKWGAWYFAFAYAGYVRSSIRMVIQTSKDFNPSEILQQVNKSVYHDSKVSEVFATLSIVVVDQKNRSVSYSGAGDLPLIYKSSTEPSVKIQSKGMLLGFVEDGGYDNKSISMKPGDSIILVTDGIIESRNKNNDQFGESRLQEILDEHNSEDLMKKIQDNFIEFTGNKFEDDVSLITIKAT